MIYMSQYILSGLLVWQLSRCLGISSSTCQVQVYLSESALISSVNELYFVRVFQHPSHSAVLHQSGSDVL